MHSNPVTGSRHLALREVPVARAMGVSKRLAWPRNVPQLPSRGVASASRSAPICQQLQTTLPAPECCARSSDHPISGASLTQACCTATPCKTSLLCTFNAYHKTWIPLVLRHGPHQQQDTHGSVGCPQARSSRRTGEWGPLNMLTASVGGASWQCYEWELGPCGHATYPQRYSAPKMRMLLFEPLQLAHLY